MKKNINEEMITKELLTQFSEDFLTSLSEEERIRLYGLMNPGHSARKSYNRIIGLDEKEAIDFESFGYLKELLRIGTIDRGGFEKIMNLCLNLQMFIKGKIDRKIIEQIVAVMIFSNWNELSVKEVIDYILHQEDDMDINVIVH